MIIDVNHIYLISQGLCTDLSHMDGSSMADLTKKTRIEAVWACTREQRWGLPQAKKSRLEFRDPKLLPRFFEHLKSRDDHLGPLKCRGDILVVLKSRRDYLGTPKNLASTF